MPVDIHLKQRPLYQRAQYEKRGLGSFYWKYRDKISLSYLNDQNAIMLDIGCGEGVTLETARLLFPQSRCIGIDGLIENLSICRAHHLNVIGGDVYHLPLQNETVDYVLFLEVIEHLVNPEMALIEIHRILKSGGKLVMVFPHDAIFRIARLLTFRFKEAFYDAGHVRQWRPADAKKMLNLYGFKVLEQKSIPFVVWPFSLHHLIFSEKERVS
jgi:ubiquinone/menaquinone biosynthesis C-methylase UbiE